MGQSHRRSGSCDSCLWRHWRFSCWTHNPTHWDWSCWRIRFSHFRCLWKMSILGVYFIARFSWRKSLQMKLSAEAPFMLNALQQLGRAESNDNTFSSQHSKFSDKLSMLRWFSYARLSSTRSKNLSKKPAGACLLLTNLTANWRYNSPEQADFSLTHGPSPINTPCV